MASALSVALFVPAVAPAAEPFVNGVTAGEITQSSAIIWGQTGTTGNVQAQVATDGDFEDLAAKRTLRAKPKADHTVQAEIKGLDAGSTYHYRFCQGQNCSDEGTFETAPEPDQAQTIRFAYTGDETGVAAPGQSTPFWGQMKAFQSMVAENNDFNIDFGDTMYSDPEVPGAPVAITVEEKWGMYRAKLALANQRAIRAVTGIYNHWDDHEFINDFSKPEDGAQIYENGVQAFRDYMPVTYTKKDGIYRSFRWGRNLELFFLDERSFRSAKASANGVCDNPATPGEADLAPTAPTATRDLFAFVAPSLGEDVSPACFAEINSPDRQYLGSAQLNRFVQDVQNSAATWKVVMNELPIQQFYVLPYDRWEGYAYERVQLLNSLTAADVDRLVFLSTDVHAALANVVRYRTLPGDAAPPNVPAGAPPIDTPDQDFAIGPVATRPLWQQIDDTVGTPGSGALVSNAFFKPPPPSGVGMACAQGGENSYAEVIVTSSQLTVEYKDENGNTLLDSNGVTPCGPYVLTE
jgi:phosphodiesterase/alkaline phosphatase D-like protein